MGRTRTTTAIVPGVAANTAGHTDTTATWRLRIRMDDSPGTLARVTIRLADLGCNILGLQVMPVPGGVVDELVLRPAAGLSRAELVEALAAEGADCAGVTDADVHELVDPSAAALAAVGRAVDDPAAVADVLREVLAADVVTLVPAAEANPVRTEGGHRRVFPAGRDGALVARRSWAPFVQLEITRAQAMLDLLVAVRANLSGPAVVTCEDGAMVVLRPGRPADADAVFALHSRCSMSTMFHRYHTGVRTVPRRWLHRLLMPPRGLSLLAVAGREVVALGQLIPAATGGTAEVSLLVEDGWQRQGLGTALIGRLAELGAAAGHHELTAVCLPGQDAVRRAALRAGLRAPLPEDGVLRIAIP
nr:GNAT family N-acetyltransferase [Amycolatopsis albispora]